MNPRSAKGSHARRHARSRQATVLSLLLALAGAAPASGIQGKVLDDRGAPLAGASAMAWTESAGWLRDQVAVRAVSDERGRFDLATPFAGVRYTVWTRKAGYESATFSLISGSSEETTVTLRGGSFRRLGGRVIDGETGLGVAGAAVHLSASGGYRRESATDGEGGFAFEDLPEGLSSAILYARRGDRISPYRVLRGEEAFVGLDLGAPARLEGIVKCRRSGKPIAGSDVFLRPGFVCEFSLRTKSGPGGRYTFDGVPPGTYQAGASSDEYFEPATRGDFLERADLPLSAGRTGFYPIELLPRARLTGRVVGPDDRPLADATLGVPECWEAGGSGSQRWSLAKTDDRGHFSLNVGRAGRDVDVKVSSPAAGNAEIEISPLEAGETREIGTVRLPGAIRSRGIVADPEGRPLSRIRVDCMGAGAEAAVTGSDGRFDLGWFPRPGPAGGGLRLRLLAPRPRSEARGDPIRHDFLEAGPRPAEASPGGPIFLHRTIPFAAKPGEIVDIDAVLHPADHVRIAGTIREGAGKPVDGARVLLFAGNADERSWQRELDPMVLGLSSVPLHRETVLGRARSDPVGTWEIRIARESEESFRIQFPGATSDPDRLSLGILSPRGLPELVRDIVLEKGEREIRKDIALDDAPLAGGISGRVVDRNGKPLAGIRLRAGYVADLRQAVTGDDGRFFLQAPGDASRGGAKVLVRLDAAGWYVLSPGADPRGTGFHVAPRETADAPPDIVLGRGGALAGSVRWSTGDPVIGYRLSWPGGEITSSDPQGSFHIEGFPPGGRDLDVASREGVKTRHAVQLSPEGTARADMVLPRPDRLLRGRVVDLRDRPVHRLIVRISGVHLETRILPDEKGSFECRLPPGEYTLTPQRADSMHSESPGETRISFAGDQREATVLLRFSD